MAAPPYSYGGGYYGPPTYRDAMLNGLQDEDPEAWRYGQPTQGRAPAGAAGTISNIAGLATPIVAKSLAPAVQSFAGNVAGSVPGSATGIGIAGEVLGAALKPKAQQVTASPYADLTDQYGRRQEGSGEGIAGGAAKWGGRGAQIGSVVPGVGTALGAGIGAAAGAIGNAFTKNAASAYTDFSRGDAEKAIVDMIRTRGGREPTAGEVAQILQSAGTKPGDKWVGEQGLYTVLNNLGRNFEAERAADPTAQAAQAYAARTGAANPMVVPGAAAGAPAAAGGTAPAADAKTGGYTPPAFTTKPTGAPPPGWDATKWADEKHQTPRYAVGRILAKYSPDDAGWQAAAAEVQKAYPGTKIIGNDKLDIPGVGIIDVRQGADAGGKGWWWGADGGGGGAAAGAGAGGGAGGATTNAGLGALPGGGTYDQSTLAEIIKRIQGIAGNTNVPTARDSVLEILHRTG